MRIFTREWATVFCSISRRDSDPPPGEPSPAPWVQVWAATNIQWPALSTCTQECGLRFGFWYCDVGDRDSASYSGPRREHCLLGAVWYDPHRLPWCSALPSCTPRTVGVFQGNACVLCSMLHRSLGFLRIVYLPCENFDACHSTLCRRERALHSRDAGMLSLVCLALSLPPFYVLSDEERSAPQRVRWSVWATPLIYCRGRGRFRGIAQKFFLNFYCSHGNSAFPKCP